MRKFALGARRRDLIELVAGVAVRGGAFVDAALEGANLVGARHQSLAGLFEQVLGQAGAGLQRVETGILHVHLVEMPVVCLIELGCETRPVGLRFAEAGLGRFEPVLRRGQGLFALVQPAHELRELGVGLVERGLHGDPLLIGLHGLLLDGLRLALDLHHLLVGCGNALAQPAVLLARLLEVGPLLLGVTLQFGDVGAARSELGELLELGPKLQRQPRGLAGRRRDDFPQADGSGSNAWAPPLDGVVFVAQLALWARRAVLSAPCRLSFSFLASS